MLCVSSLAFNDISEIPSLREMGITCVETVFTKIKDWGELSTDDILQYKKFLDDHQLQTLSAQSLFHKIQYTLSDEELILSHLDKLIHYSKLLGIKKLVFGSPMMRKGDPRRIFRLIDNMLIGTDIKLLIEPNTKMYGGSYFFTVSEIVEFIEINSLRNISTMVDTHNSRFEYREPAEDFWEYSQYIDHIHVSQPRLLPFKPSRLDEELAKTLKQRNYNKIVTYEVLPHDLLKQSIVEFSEMYK